MKLLYANQTLLKINNKLDTEIYTGSQKIIMNVLPLIDRTGNTQMPYDFAIYDDFKMPAPDSAFNLDYQECCYIRTKEIIAISDRKNLPIRILWSGGIDSTLIIVNFIKILGLEQAKDRLIISLSIGSISENYHFYKTYLKDFRCESGYAVESLLDGNSIVVTGEYNDQIFGTDLANQMRNYFKKEYNYTDNYDRDKWHEYIGHKGTGVIKFQESINSPFFDRELVTDAWVNLIESSAEKSGLGLTSMFDYWWWFNFNFKWQSIYFRLLIRTKTEYRKSINQEFCKDHLIYFFGDQRFQQWAFHNRSQYEITRWQDFKMPAKRIIYDFDRNEDYLQNKTKKGSLYQILNDTSKCLAITENFEFLTDFNPEDYYKESNFFNDQINKNGA